MKDMHLTTDQMQNYLDGNIKTEKNVIEKHLEVCQHCRMELKRYEKLYTELGKDEGFELSPGFAENVLTEVRNIEGAEKKGWYFEAGFVALGTAITLAVIYYFTGWGFLKSSVISYFKPQWVFFNDLFEELLSSVSSWGINQKLILPVLIVIVSTALIDYLIKNRHKLLSTSQNRMFV